MPTYGPGSLPPAYTWADDDTAADADGVSLGEFLEIDRQEIRALWNQLWLKATEPRLIVNGNYAHWQRVEGGSQTCTTSFNAITSFGPDRLFTLPAGASVSVARSTTVPDSKSRFSCAITGASSVTTVDHGQRIRSDYRTRYKQELTFSAYVRNESGASFTPTLMVDTPGAADDWTTPTNRLAQTLQACADSAWTRVSYTFDPSAYTNIDNGLSVYLRVPSGSLVSGDVVRIAQFRLEPAAAVTPYVPPDPELERIRCLAYYRKSYSEGVALQTATEIGLAGQGFFGSGASNVYITVPFGAAMWKIPTIRLWDAAGTANQFTDITGPSHHATAVANRVGTGGFLIANSGTATEIMFVHYDAVAEVV